MRWLPSVCRILCREDGKTQIRAPQGESALEVQCVDNDNSGQVCLPSANAAAATLFQCCIPTAVFWDQRSKRETLFKDLLHLQA